MSKVNKFFHGQWPEAPWKNQKITEMTEERLSEALDFVEKYGGSPPNTITREDAAKALAMFSAHYPDLIRAPQQVFLVKLITPYVADNLPSRKTYMLRYDAIQVTSSLARALEFIRTDTRLIERNNFHFFTISLSDVNPEIDSNESEYVSHIGYYNDDGDRIPYPTKEVREWLEST